MSVSVVEREVDEVGEHTTLAHRVGALPLCELEFGDPMASFEIVGPARVVAGAQGWPIGVIVSSAAVSAIGHGR